MKKRPSRTFLSNFFPLNLKLINILPQDVVYIDPPWGGIGYKNKNKLDLYLSNMEIYKIIAEIKNYHPNSLVFLKLPLNANLNNIDIKNKFVILNKKELPSFYLIQITK